MKEKALEEIKELMEITAIKESKFAEDATSLQRCGGVLLGVAKLPPDDEDEAAFMYSIGWPRRAGEPPRFWTEY